MKPFSALYYIRENKWKAAICIVMIVMTGALYVYGNIIHSCQGSYAKEYEYSDKMVLVNAVSTDEDFSEYHDFLNMVKKDEKLKVMERTARGYSGLQHMTAMGIKMGGASYVFQTLDDMKAAFRHLGIKCDFDDVKSGSMVISRDFANNLGVRKGDVLDHSFDNALDGTYSVDAIIDDGSYICFYLIEAEESNLLRMYIYSDDMEGDELYSYVKNLAADKNVLVSESYRDMVSSQFDMFYVIFYAVVVLLSIIFAVTANSVMTGQYIKRRYEFGIYLALGRSKGEVRRKCASEILMMDIIGVVIGMSAAFIISYLLNELFYKPKGIFFLYASDVGIVGYVLCNILIIGSLILTKGRMCTRADVTEF